MQFYVDKNGIYNGRLMILPNFPRKDT